MTRAGAGRISTRLVSSLLLAWREMGIDVDRVVERAGVDAATLDDPDAYLPAQDVGRLGYAAYVASGDPLLGLHTAERYRPGSIPVVDYLILSAPTLRDAIERYVRYDRLLQNVSVTTLEVAEGRATVRHESTGLAPPNAAASENALASAVVFGRHLTAEPIVPVEVRFVHAAPPDASEHERVFRAPVRFSQPDNAVVFDAELLSLPLPRANPGVSTALQQHADELLERLEVEDRAVTASARRATMDLLSSGDATLARVAGRLGIGQRTLRRRLSDEGTSFREVVEGVQHELARDHLRRREVAIEELGLMLGFSDGRAFRRAFKRWQGVSPADYRRRFRGA